MGIAFRAGRKKDAYEIACLFQITSEGMADYIWSQLAQPGQALIEVGTARYAREQVDFSYENCLIAEANDTVIGMMHSYITRLAPDASPTTDPVLAPYADMEIPDSLYISSLAFHDGWRNQGLGTRFIELAKERARTLTLNGISLIDYASNTGARRFYERHGFNIVKVCDIVPHPLVRVTGEAYLMHWSEA
ncbi:GNAT family N-acetyltransferase [Pseudomonas sp. NPDC089554]|uniref:GNAT family N-acetyltransferase n=1 Tax=Pseudomonas sp. NPDC089554 TaxID=3390653 RepID=UPI003D078B21